MELVIGSCGRFVEVERVAYSFSDKGRTGVVVKRVMCRHLSDPTATSLEICPESGTVAPEKAGVVR